MIRNENDKTHRTEPDYLWGYRLSKEIRVILSNVLKVERIKPRGEILTEHRQRLTGIHAEVRSWSVE